jgi:membrane associated rhomboid family serine protease
MFNRLPPVILNLVILNVIVFVAQFLIGAKIGESTMSEWFLLHKSDALGIHQTVERNGTTYFAAEQNGRLVPIRSNQMMLTPERFRPVQIVTHFFSHGGIFHILINMFVLVSLGSSVERVLGGKRFLEMYLFAGVFGGILTAFLDPTPFPVVGASGAIFGVAGLLAVLFPNTEMMIIPIPIPIKAWKLVLGVGLLSLGFVVYTFINPTGGGGISHFGHLSGLVSGLGWYFGRRYINNLNS